MGASIMGALCGPCILSFSSFLVTVSLNDYRYLHYQCRLFFNSKLKKHILNTVKLGWKCSCLLFFSGCMEQLTILK